ncbi:MAG: hypothetical protein JST92_14825 [Deltaproteobacteria bacterium]|nr:hypothetical protein [Deltaproteobacteria bacterium]
MSANLRIRVLMRVAAPAGVIAAFLCASPAVAQTGAQSGAQAAPAQAADSAKAAAADSKPESVLGQGASDRPVRVRASHRVDVVAPGEKVDTIIDRMRASQVRTGGDVKTIAPTERPAVRPPDRGRDGERGGPPEERGGGGSGGGGRGPSGSGGPGGSGGSGGNGGGGPGGGNSGASDHGHK